MAFRLMRDAKKWFSEIERELELEFDMYYFCVVAGINADRKADAAQSDASDLTQSFPGPYKRIGRLLIAQFLNRELASKGIDLSERLSVHAAIREYLDPVSPSWLSSYGERELNRYANGGFELLTAKFGDKPRALEVFLPRFYDYVGSLRSRI